jgi:hypothetical protein
MGNHTSCKQDGDSFCHHPHDCYGSTETPPTDSKTQIAPDDELVEAVQTAIDEWFAGDMTFRQQLIGQFVAQSILPLLASREAAVLERAAKVARDYANKARRREWVNGPDSAATAGDHIASQIRTLSKGETP